MMNHQERMRHKTFVLTESESSFQYIKDKMKLEQPIRIFDRSLMCGLGKDNASLIVYLVRQPRPAEKEMIVFARSYDFPVFIVTDELRIT